jgi:predicted small integral membrane protein
MAAYVNLAFIGLAGRFQEWFGLASEPSIWISFVLSMLLLALVMRKG